MPDFRLGEVIREAKRQREESPAKHTDRPAIERWQAEVELPSLAHSIAVEKAEEEAIHKIRHLKFIG